MKNKFLKLQTPCDENWENMTPNEKGRFCDSCSKNVIDFSQMSLTEITKIMKKSDDNICARVSKKQLDIPLLDFTENRNYKLPYSQIAAGLMISGSLIAAQPSVTQNSIPVAQIEQTTNTPINPSEKENPDSKPADSKPLPHIVFKGIVTSHETGEPVVNAKITFISLEKMISTYTLSDGSFALKIDGNLVDKDNVFRVSYEEVDREMERHGFWGYEDEDIIVSSKEFNAVHEIQAEHLMLIMGGIGHYTREYKPMVLDNGKEIKYEDFAKMRMKEDSPYSYEKKDYYYFEPKFAKAIAGKKAQDGLYMFFDKKRE
jgi:hypothetical protein